LRLRSEQIKVREETYTVREWTVAERAEFHKRWEENKPLACIYLVSVCTVNPDGSRRFADVDAAGAEAADVADALAEKAFLVSGVKKGD
jgi:hypothetical protein